jgi:hypothetical protein
MKFLCINTYPQTKVYWLADCVLLIPSSAGLFYDKKGGVEFATYACRQAYASHWHANGKHTLAVLTNNKQEKVDQIVKYR